MDIANLIDNKKVKLAELKSVIENGKTENRKLTEIEERNIETLSIEIAEIEKEIENRNTESKKIKDINKMEKFNLLRAI